MGPADDDKDVALAVTSSDDEDDDDLAAADDDAVGAGAGSIVLSGQASPSARHPLTDDPARSSDEAPVGELIVRDAEGALLGSGSQNSAELILLSYLSILQAEDQVCDRHSAAVEMHCTRALQATDRPANEGFVGCRQGRPVAMQCHMHSLCTAFAQASARVSAV